MIQDVVEWCGGAITLREARRFRQLVNIPQWSDIRRKVRARCRRQRVGSRDLASDLRCQHNNGALVDSVLDGVDAGNMTQLAAVVLTVLIAAWLLWRYPGALANVR